MSLKSYTILIPFCHINITMILTSFSAKTKGGDLTVDNLDNIFNEVDIVNIDRGDLSTDIGLIKLGLVQHGIIENALRSSKKIFLATQFLKNMEKSPVPSIAEVIDLYKTIKQGVYGIQLSEETAIGKYAVECVKLVFDMYNNCTCQTLKVQNYSTITNTRLECLN